MRAENYPRFSKCNPFVDAKPPGTHNNQKRIGVDPFTRFLRRAHTSTHKHTQAQARAISSQLFQTERGNSSQLISRRLTYLHVRTSSPTAAMKRGKRCFIQSCLAPAPFASPLQPDVHACEVHKKRDFVNMRNKVRVVADDLRWLGLWSHASQLLLLLLLLLQQPLLLLKPVHFDGENTRPGNEIRCVSCSTGGNRACVHCSCHCRCHTLQLQMLSLQYTDPHDISLSLSQALHYTHLVR